jgi:hypothetical protein
MTTTGRSFAVQLRFEAWLADQADRTDEIGDLARGITAGRYHLHQTHEIWIENDKRRARAEFDALDQIGLAETTAALSRVEQFGFERWLARQARRGDNTGVLARAIGDGRIKVYGEHEPAVARQIDMARFEVAAVGAGLSEGPDVVVSHDGPGLTRDPGCSMMTRRRRRASIEPPSPTGNHRGPIGPAAFVNAGDGRRPALHTPRFGFPSATTYEPSPMAV